MIFLFPGWEYVSSLEGNTLKRHQHVAIFCQQSSKGTSLSVSWPMAHHATTLTFASSLDVAELSHLRRRCKLLEPFGAMVEGQGRKDVQCDQGEHGETMWNQQKGDGLELREGVIKAQRVERCFFGIAW